MELEEDESLDEPVNIQIETLAKSPCYIRPLKKKRFDLDANDSDNLYTRMQLQALKIFFGL